MKTKFFFLPLLLLLLSIEIHANMVLKLGSATQGEGYDNLAISIQKILKDNHFKQDIKVITTSGSTDNIHRIKNGQLDLAIVQNDTVFFAENGLGTFIDPINDLTMIMAFYDEPIYLLTNIPRINSIEQLSNIKINVGLEESGLHESVKVLLTSSNLWDKVKKYNFDSKKSMELLYADKVQAVFLNQLNTKIRTKLDKQEIFLVPISRVLIKKLKQTFTYFSEFKVNNEVTTLAVKSILIAKKDIDKEIIYKLTRLLYENYQDLEFPKGLEKSKDAFSANPLNAWHTGTQAFFETENIKPSIVSDSDGYVLYVIFSIFLIVPLLLFIIFSILYSTDIFFTASSQHALVDSVKILYLKLLNYKYILFFVIMLMLYLICILLVKYFEHTWAIQHNIFSSFDNIPLYKSLLWLFVFAMSGFNDSIFPHSNEGKFIVSLIPMIGLGGILALAGLITSDQIKKYFLEAKGMGTRKDRNHIILCGWNDNAHFIVENLLHKNISVKKKIVILADLDDKDKIEQFEFDKRYVSYVSGNAGSRNDLERANFVEADMAIVVPNGHSEDRDARVILNVLTIEKFCLELEESGERSKLNIHTIAQISDAKNEQIAQDAGVDQIISLGNIESKIFTQAVHNPGVAKFVNEVFTYNDANDIYSLLITENSTLFDKTYDEILSILREHKILLLSINIEFRKNAHDVKNILKESKLSKTIITNPFDEYELAYRTKKDDLLIVLAQYEENIIKAVKELEME